MDKRRLRDAKVLQRQPSESWWSVPISGSISRIAQSCIRASAKNLSEDEDTRVHSDEEVHPADEAADVGCERSKRKDSECKDPRWQVRAAFITIGKRGAKNHTCDSHRPPMGSHLHRAYWKSGPIDLGGACSTRGATGKLDSSRAERVLWGIGTNNIAELTAILRALQITDASRPASDLHRFQEA